MLNTLERTDTRPPLEPKRHYFKRRAEQKGVTLQEVLIGIAIAAVIAASSIFLGARFIGQGQFASARQTLQTASLATEQIYASIIEGGGRSYVGVRTSTTGTVTTVANATSHNPIVLPVTRVVGTTHEVLSVAAVDKLNKLGEDINFVASSGDKVAAVCGSNRICKTSNSAGSGIIDLKEKDVWVEVLYSSTALPVDAQAIRLGTKAGNGATLCVVIVKQAASGSNLGKIYQTANADTSKASPATCGLGTEGDATNLPAGSGAPSGYATSIVDPG